MSGVQGARSLRKRSTWAERLVWGWLRDRRFNSYKFRRQHPLGSYTLDFYCEEARLSIELDGMGHGHPEAYRRDDQRRMYLEALGIQELRFWNSRLRREAESIRNTIFKALQERAPRE